MKLIIFGIFFLCAAPEAMSGQFTTYRWNIEMTYVNPCHLIKTLECPERRIHANKNPKSMYSGCSDNYHWLKVAEDCNQQFEATWQDAVEELNYCIPKNLRPRRSALVPVVELLGTVTTNLIKSKMEKTNNNNYESVRDKVYNDVVQKTEIQQEMQSNIMKELSSISSASRNHQDMLEQMSTQFPINVWTLATINRKLITMTSDLKTVRKECLKRQVATLELGELFNSDEIARMDPSDTYVEELSANAQTYHIRIIFTYRNSTTTLLPVPEKRNTTKIEVKKIMNQPHEEKENFNLLFFLILNLGLGSFLLLMIGCHLFRGESKEMATVSAPREEDSTRPQTSIWN